MDKFKILQGTPNYVEELLNDNNDELELGSTLTVINMTSSSQSNTIILIKITSPDIKETPTPTEQLDELLRQQDPDTLSGHLYNNRNEKTDVYEDLDNLL
jgi:maltooligosyltrehalose synthase